MKGKLVLEMNNINVVIIMKSFPCRRMLLYALVSFIIISRSIYAQTPTTEMPAILDIGDQEKIVFEITQKRLEVLLPRIMEEAGIDMWIIACNEDNWDPIFKTMIPHKMWTPITQILVMYRRGPGDVERLNISRANLDGLFTRAWTNTTEESQWDCLTRIVYDRDPKKIGLNIGEIQWAAGGLTFALHRELSKALGEKYTKRVTSAEDMVISWSVTLLDEEVKLMERAIAVSHGIIAEIFSNRVITPNMTTIDDLKLYYKQKVANLGLEISFNPGFFLRGRRPENVEKYGANDHVIRPGDFVYCDVGLKYLRYNTDNKGWGYVVKPGENDAPGSYKELLAESNRFQEIFCNGLRVGLTGNELLNNIMNEARKQGIPGPRIYSHSVGYFVHEPGPLIGLPWEQENIPGRGDVKLAYNSCLTIEISVAKPMIELNGENLDFKTEEIIFFSEKDVIFLDGRQTGFYLIK